MTTLSDYVDQAGVRRRHCCDMPYSNTHTDDCPVRGAAARAALPCDITEDGWCFNHSTGHGAVYCPTPSLEAGDA